MTTSRPNILLITTDQQRADHLGLAGLKAVQTPHLDRLGREGIHYQRAYTVCPLCTPARVSMMTGQYPSRHGAYSIGVSAPLDGETTLPARLAQTGYHTALFGKSHFVQRSREWEQLTGISRPSPEFFRTFHGPALGFQELALSSGHTINAVPDGHYLCFLEDQGVNPEAWFPQMGPAYDHDAVGIWDIPVAYHDSTWVGTCTTDFIERQSSTDTPWFAWASFQDPHEPYVCPGEWMNRVDPDAMEIPEGYREEEFDDKPAFYRQAYETGCYGTWEDEHGVPCAGRRESLTEHAAKALRATLGMVAGIDDQVGRILAALEATGQADNTVIVFTSDHGEYHGHHGFWGKGLPAYEDAQRVPLLVWGPGAGIPQQNDTRPVSWIDLPATFLDLARAPIPPGMQGHSLRSRFQDFVSPEMEEVLIELRPVEGFSQQTFIKGDLKLVIYEREAEGELYDLAADPDQYHNLWADSAWQDTRMNLLHAFCRFQQRNEGKHLPRTAFA